MNKKLLATICISLCMLLVACGGGKNDSEQQEQAPNTQEVTKEGKNDSEQQEQDENFTDVEDVILYQAPNTQEVTKEVINQENGIKETVKIKEEIQYDEYEGYYKINAFYYLAGDVDERVQLSIVDDEGYNIAMIYVPYEVWKQWEEMNIDFSEGDVCYFKQSKTGLQAYKLIKQ